MNGWSMSFSLHVLLLLLFFFSFFSLLRGISKLMLFLEGLKYFTLFSRKPWSTNICIYLRDCEICWKAVIRIERSHVSCELSKRWLAQWSGNPVEGVCGRTLFAKQDIFPSAVFSSKFFHLIPADTLKSYNSKGISSIALKFGQ